MSPVELYEGLSKIFSANVVTISILKIFNNLASMLAHWQLPFLYYLCAFSKYKFAVHFSKVICKKTRPCTPLLFIWKWITSTLSSISLETNCNVLVLEFQFFQRIRFLEVRFYCVEGQDPGPAYVLILNCKKSDKSEKSELMALKKYIPNQ